MKSFILYIGLLASMMVSSCRFQVSEQKSGTHIKGEIRNNLYAKGFKIEKYPDFKILDVYNPWQHAQGVVYRYVLTHDPQLVPDSLRKNEIILTPVKRIICLSTTHLAFISALNEQQSVCGVAAPELIYDPVMRQKVARGEIRSVGYDQALNLESIISLRPDFVMAYGVGSESSGQFQRLQQLGIKVVFNAEYLEATPLGKAEWLSFVGAFFDKEDTATQIFQKTAENYTTLTREAALAKSKPMVLSGLPWKGVWYVPGGKSYASGFIYDAGGDYLWKDNQGQESLPLSLEAVLERTGKADIWINPGSVENVREIIHMDPRLQNVKPLREQQIYNFSRRRSPAGGNDFWESGVVHPDWVLRDLIAIFHPELLPDHTFVYYQKLN